MCDTFYPITAVTDNFRGLFFVLYSSITASHYPVKKKQPDIFRKVLWFSRQDKFDIDYFDVLQPCRTVSEHPRYKSGVFYSEKCRRDIQYESGLELDFIKKHLEGNYAVLFYWEQPVAIPYRRGNIRTKTTPDFGVYLRSHHFVIVEVKPLAEMIDHRVQAKAEGVMAFCSRRGFGFLLTDGRHTPAQLLKGKVNRTLEKELSAALDGGILRKIQTTGIMESCNATQAELHRAVIRLDLKFKPYPFKLQRGNQSPIFRDVYFRKKRYDDLITKFYISPE